MSETSSLLQISSPSRIKAEHHILLVDRTASQAHSYRSPDTELSDSDASAVTPAQGTLYQRLTHTSTGLRQNVKQQYNKQKYAKYGQDRYHTHEPAEPAEPAIDEHDAGMPESAEQASLRQRSYITRAQSKVQSHASRYLKRKKTLGKGDEEDTVVDVLYENQRGMFVFGIPKYSSASLLPNDPRPWQNGQFRTSAVDIRNAQVPDPSWEWTWKSWYVDMSRDVDEEGWEYSFAFVGRAGATFAWHGNHPWFHSFVRRRRWLRMRRRKDLIHKTREQAHELTADYFTIHPKMVRDSSQDRSSTLAQARTRLEQDFDVEKMDILTIADLLLALRKSTVDREKIAAIKKFIDQGGDEIFYLSESMEDIMKQLMFQSSRQQLLSDLISRHDRLRQEQEALESHQHEDDEKEQKQHDSAVRRAQHLHNAVHAAEQQVKKLEYWSDIKNVTDAASLAGSEEGHNEPTFKSKQRATSVAPDLTTPPANGNDVALQHAVDANSTAASKSSSVWFETESKMTKSSKKESDPGEDTEPDNFEIAPETPQNSSSLAATSSKGKAPAASPLDGVAEEIEAVAEEARDAVDEQLISADTGSRGNNRRSVQIVEPMALDSTNERYDSHHSSEEEADDNVNRDGTKSPVDRGEAKTPDSVRQLMTHMRKPKNWIDQAFG